MTNLQNLYVFLLVSAFIGYPFAAMIPTLIGVDSTIASYPFRLIILSTSIYFILLSLLKQKFLISNTLFLLFCLIWIIVLARFFYEGVLLGNPIHPERSFVSTLIYAGLISFIPSIVFLVDFDKDCFYKFNKYFFLGSLILCLAYSFIFTSYLSLDEGRRSGTDSINSITLSTLGAYLFLSSISIEPLKKSKLLSLQFKLASIFIALYLMMISGSRGPLLILIITSMIYFYKLTNSRLLLFSFAIVPLIFIYINFDEIKFLSSLYFDNVILVNRLLEGAEDGSSAERILILISSWNIFIENPLLGGAFVEPITLSYPHNLLLEGLMIGGILLGLLIIIILYFIFTTSLKMLSDPDLKLLGIVLIFCLGMTMVSGSFIWGPEFWYIFAISISYNTFLKNQYLFDQ